MTEERLSEVTLEKLENARFVRPYSIRFKLGDKERRWFVIQGLIPLYSALRYFSGVLINYFLI